jgi:hypothetical protein
MRIPRSSQTSLTLSTMKVIMKNSTTAGLLKSFVAVISALILLEGDAFSTSSSSRLQKRPCRFRREPVRLLAAVTVSASQTTRDEAVCKVLDLARKLGPIGALQSPEDQERILIAAQALTIFSDEKPARQKLGGSSPGEPSHCLVYSSSPGGSSGRLFGSVYGNASTKQIL